MDEKLQSPNLPCTEIVHREFRQPINIRSKVKDQGHRVTKLKNIRKEVIPSLHARAVHSALTFWRSLSSSRAPSDHMMEKTMSSLRWLELMSLLSSLTGISPSSKSSAWRTYMHSSSWNITQSSLWSDIVNSLVHKTWRSLWCYYRVTQLQSAV